MEYIAPQSRISSRVIDSICIMMIGVGFGGLSMYYYALKHPSQIMQAQPHVLIEPQDNTAGKLMQAQPNLIYEI